MSTAALFQAFGLGSIGLFSSRAFLPAFVAALVMRFGQDLPLIGSALPAGYEHAPTWFTHGLTITILGVLSALEIAADKSPEAREILQTVDQYYKPVMAMLTYYGIVAAQDAAFLDKSIGDIPQQAGMLALIPAAMIGAGVFYFATVRAGMLELFSEADEDDALGVRWLYSWMEDVWTALGPIVLIVYPLVMIGLIALSLGAMVLIEKRARAKEEKRRVACASCGEMMYGCAPACPRCGARAEQVRAVGFFGQTKDQPAGDLDNHPYRLVEKRRCPVCATRFEQRSPRQRCETCGHELMGDPAFVRAYLARVAGRLPGVLAVCALLSFIPVFGLIPGVIYYRLALVAPFRRYLPLGRGLILKWVIRALFLVLILLQLLPIAGAAAVPAMALLNYWMYRGTFVKLAVAR